jgi:hypothetical protein
MPAKCGSSPREKMGMVLLLIEGAPWSPILSPRCVKLIDRRPGNTRRPSKLDRQTVVRTQM